MKNRIFMYLFIFTLLLVVFQYVNSKNIIESYDDKYERSLEKYLIYQDTISNLRDQVLTLSEFKLDETEAALTYF